MMRFNSYRLPGRGFSLVEMLVTLAISTIIGGAIIAAMVSQMQISATQNRNILNHDQIRETLTFMSDEIRSMGDGATEPFLINADPNLITFNTDVDGNGVLDRVSYTLNGTQIERTLSTSPDNGLTWNQVSNDVMLENVSELTFTYFGFGNTVNPAMNAVTSVEVRLVLNVAATSTGLTQGKLAPQAMASRATIRNRLLN